MRNFIYHRDNRTAYAVDWDQAVAGSKAEMIGLLLYNWVVSDFWTMREANGPKFSERLSLVRAAIREYIPDQDERKYEKKSAQYWLHLNLYSKAVLYLPKSDTIAPNLSGPNPSRFLAELQRFRSIEEF